MTHAQLTPVPDPINTHVTEASIRAFVAEQSKDLAPPTAERYAITVDSLFDFLDEIDVGPRFGTELARHLEAARARLGSGAFLPTLGVVSMIRVLPDFLDDPWLPPTGAQRRSHRVVADRLITYLRRHLGEVGPVREDLRRARRALGTAQARDFDWQRKEIGVDDDDLVTVTSTIEVTSSRLDRMLDGVEEGIYSSLDAAIESAVEPNRGSDPWRHYW